MRHGRAASLVILASLLSLAASLPVDGQAVAHGIHRLQGTAATRPARLVLLPAGALGASNCVASPLYPDPHPGFTMCATVAQQGDLYTVLVTAPSGASCVATATFSPPPLRVMLAPSGTVLRRTGVSGVVRYTFSGAGYPRHGDHVLLAAECSTESATGYALRNVDYLTGERLPAGLTN